MVALPETVIHDAKLLAEKVASLGVAEGADAVVTVLLDHIKRLDRRRRLASLNAIVSEFQATLPAGTATSKEVQEELYDEHGLPK